jgi:hypothetical protein
MEKPPEVKAEKAVKRIRSVDTKTRRAEGEFEGMDTLASDF